MKARVQPGGIGIGWRLAYTRVETSGVFPIFRSSAALSGYTFISRQSRFRRGDGRSGWLFPCPVTTWNKTQGDHGALPISKFWPDRDGVQWDGTKTMTSNFSTNRQPANAPLDGAAAGRIIDAAVRRYFEARRARVDPFIDAHFTLSGALDLHRKAIGLDLVRAPANVALMLPAAGMKLGGMAARRLGARRAGDWLMARNPLLRTQVDRELEWLIHAELLELPFDDGTRNLSRDALAEEILLDPDLAGALIDPLRAIGGQAEDPELRDKVTDILEAYAGTRTAASELAGAMVNLGAGAFALNQFTPTAVSLGPALAGVLAQNLAVSSFPLGGTLGGLWYGVFPAAPTAALVGVTTGGLIAGLSVATAFAGVITDPIQRRLGLHRRRLRRMLDVLERNFQGRGAQAFVVREVYAARLLDLVDVLRTVHRALG